MGEARHRLREVDDEHQAGRVRRGAAGLEEGSLVDDDDVRPPELAEVVGDAAAGDAGPDDRDACVPRQIRRTRGYGHAASYTGGHEDHRRDDQDVPPSHDEQP